MGSRPRDDGVHPRSFGRRPDYVARRCAAIYLPPLVLVHASPSSAWRSPPVGASDVELESTYLPLGQPIAVYGHIHQPFVRDVAGLTVINTGSVNQSFDGDPRASYLLADNGTPRIRRIRCRARNQGRHGQRAPSRRLGPALYGQSALRHFIIIP